MASEARAFADDLGDWVRGSARRLSGAESRALSERFVAWAQRTAQQDSDADNAQLQAWIEDLDSEGQQALTEQLAIFCTDFDIELAWLVDGDLADWPDLETSLRHLVTHYCLACKAAVDGDELMQRFRRRHTWQRKIKAPREPADTPPAAE